MLRTHSSAALSLAVFRTTVCLCGGPQGCPRQETPYPLRSFMHWISAYLHFQNFRILFLLLHLLNIFSLMAFALTY